MHLLVATHDLYPDPGSGGTGRYVYETALRLVQRGHHVSVVTRRRGDVPARETVEGVDVYRYDLDVAGEPAPTVAAQLPAARRAVARAVGEAEASGDDSGAVDAVSFQGPVTSPLTHLAVDSSVPRICTFHSPWPTEYGIRARHEGTVGPVRRGINVAVRSAVEAGVLDACDGVVTLSEFMADRLAGTYGDRFDPTVVPGGVDLGRYSPDAGSAESPSSLADDDGVSFLTVRRLSPRMGHGTLLEAFAKVAGTHPDATLHVAGDGPLRADLEADAERLGIADRTTFLGYVPDAELPATYADADVFVLPTQLLEGFGLATLESLASGTPVVATPVGGTTEILSEYADRTGVDASLLTDGTDAEALAEAMADWADLPPERRERAGRACRRLTAELFDWNRTVDRLDSTYASHVDGNQ